MVKKKVTLSIDSKTYEGFKGYCEKNAIVLSKRIEIFMLELLKATHNVKAVLFILMSVLISFNVGAMTIINETFESGSLSSWILTANNGAFNWTASSTNPFQGSFHAQSEPRDTLPVPASVMERIISTSGYQNISIKYYRQLVAFDSGDEFEVEWFNGASWTSIELNNTGGNDASYVLKQFNLSSGASNNTNFRIKFECTAGAIGEFCRVDNLEIGGNSIDFTNPVVSLNFPLNNTFTSVASITFNASFTDNIALKNATLYIWNSSNFLVNSTSRNVSGISNSTSIVVTLPYEGRFYWNYFVFDDNGNSAFNNGNFTFVYDSTLPGVLVTNPQNGINYSSIQTALNFTVSDLNLQSCWYSLNNGLTNVSVTCGNNVTGLSSVQGSNIWKVYANDSAGNVNSSSVTFNVDSVGPIVSVSYPQNSSNYSSIQTALNFTVSDLNLQSCWYSLNNGLTNVSVTCGNNVTGLSSVQGSNIWKVYANDSAGNVNSSSVTFNVDSVFPNVQFVYPQNNSLFITKNITLNYTISDLNLQSCWHTNNSGLNNQTLVCGQNISEIWNEGINNVIIYSNDTFGNVNSSSVTFNIDSILPVVTLEYPQDGSTLGENVSVSLNFTVSDLNLQSCWYNVDSLLNISLLGCANSTFNVSEGSHTIRVYANDSFANLGQDASTFNVQVGAPSISISSPQNGVYLNNSDIYFNFTASDPTLNSCDLYGDFNGTYSLNQTNSTINSGTGSFFNLNLTDESYLWALSCNDTLGNRATTTNQTIHVDTIRPSVNLIEPSGTYASISNIPLILSYSDTSPVKCYYNVTFVATGVVVIENSELINCTNTNFNVDIESNYFFTLAVNDSAENTNITRNTFTISLGGGNSGSVSGGSSGGGSSGGGGSISGMASFDLNLGNLEILKINRGGSETIELPVANKGLRFLNECHFSAIGGISDWISGREVNSLSPGQSADYIFTVNVPIDAEVGNYLVSLGVNCIEYNETFTYEVEVVGGEFELTILNSERIGTKLRATYAVENFGEKSKEIRVDYKLFDYNSKLVVEGSGDFTVIPVNERFEGNIEFELPKNSIGDYMLVMEATDGFDMTQKQQQVRLTTGGIVGFAISENNLRTIGWFGLVILLSLGIYISIKTIKHQLALRRANEEASRQFISIDLN